MDSKQDLEYNAFIESIVEYSGLARTFTASKLAIKIFKRPSFMLVLIRISYKKKLSLFHSNFFKHSKGGIMPLQEQKNHIICFIDILGFKDKIFKDQTDFLEKYLTIKDHLIEEWNKVDEKKNFKFHSFSDSLIISVETENRNPTERQNQLKHLSIAVASLQFFMAANDIWMRGGISCGLSFINTPTPGSQTGTLLFGKAFIYAHELESKHAKFPRVLLDTSLIQHCGFQDSHELITFMNNDNNFTNWKGDLVFDWEKIRKHRVTPLIQNDYPLFLDYLDYLFQELETDNLSFETRVQIIRKILKKNLMLSNSIYEKFRWVTDYIITKTELKYVTSGYTKEALALVPELNVLYTL